MHSHSEVRHSPYSTAQLMSMVLDVERYPEFLPWCRAARILERHPDYFLGELVISFNHLSERYTSKIIPIHGAQEQIMVELVKGPFNYLTNHWKFTPTATGTDIHFHLEFAFKSRLLDTLMGAMFTRATEKMVAAFDERSKALYGGVHA